MPFNSNKDRFHVHGPIGLHTWTDGIMYVVRMLHVRETKAYIWQNWLIGLCQCIKYTGFSCNTCYLNMFRRASEDYFKGLMGKNPLLIGNGVFCVGETNESVLCLCADNQYGKRLMAIIQRDKWICINPIITLLSPLIVTSILLIYSWLTVESDKWQ